MTDPLVKSCYDLLMASTWTARYGTEAERWETAEHMARESRKRSERFAELIHGGVTKCAFAGAHGRIK